MNDIGIGIPVVMPLPLDSDFVQLVLEHAMITRGEGLNHARRELEKDSEATLSVILTLLKVLVIARTEEVLALSPQLGMKIDCRPGCSACCYQNVEVSIPEAILVALQVAEPTDPRRAGILETADATANMDPAARVRARLPCPLLVADKCSVYENRPLLCRATLSPCAQTCYEVLEGKDSVLQIYGGPQFFALGDKDAMRGICKDLGLQSDSVDLVQTVAAILRDASTVIRWSKGETVFSPIQKVAVQATDAAVVA
jgi:hypothetical protein